MPALWTGKQKNDAKAWLLANASFFTQSGWYREGIKDEDGKAVYGTADVLDVDGAPTGETYEGRTFTVLSHDYVDPFEVAFAITVWARENSISTDEIDDVEALLAEEIKNFLTNSGISVVGDASRPRSVVEDYVVANL
jgi:hypothetical protein